MFTLSSQQRFLLHLSPVDMRKGFDGLSGLVRNELQSDPCNGDVFVFVGKTRDKIKLLQWQAGGFVLYYKRLEAGRFHLPDYDPKAGVVKFSYAQLAMLVDGLSIQGVARQKRFAQQAQRRAKT
jgi:transposase